MRRSLKISEYDYEIIHRPGKKHLNVDALSKNLSKMSNFVMKTQELRPIIDLDTSRIAKKMTQSVNKLKRKKL